MTYIKGNLAPGEDIIFEDKIHPIYTYSAIIFAIIFFIFCFIYPEGSPFFLPVCMVFIYLKVKYSNIQYYITNKRIGSRTGILSRDIKEVQLSKFESLKENKTLSDMILGSGKVIVTGTGGTNVTLEMLGNPNKVKNTIYEEVEKLKNSSTNNQQDGNKKCPFCAEEIKIEAIVCKHCGKDLN